MYAIEESVKKINGVEVATFQRDVVEGNAILMAEAGTTGFTGNGCRKAGGRTILQIGCVDGDFCFRPIINDEKKTIGVIIAGSGDDALNAIVKTLGFCLAALVDQCTEVDD